MGTGGTPPVWSPEKRPAGGGGRAGRTGVGPIVCHTHAVREWLSSLHDGSSTGLRHGARTSRPVRSPRRPWRGRCGHGSGWSSRLAVGTGPLRRSPTVHFQPIDLVVFQEPSADCGPPGNLVLKRASRLDAFSAYPVPTWLPGGAPSGTAGTPAVGPPQSSRTRGDPSQVSYTHGR